VSLEFGEMAVRGWGGRATGTGHRRRLTGAQALRMSESGIAEGLSAGLIWGLFGVGF
jgi:hypothetical protein